ncbi:MAG: hypothetical protein ACLQFR_04555 [Streptosporangiaceae bacterium]
MSVDDMKDVSLPARFRRRQRIIIPVVIAVLAIGAFLQWGPIGIGNGPLLVGEGGGTSTVSEPNPAPIADMIPIAYSGSCPITIDGITLVNRTSYPSPYLVAVELLLADLTQCTFGPAHAAAHGFVVSTCGKAKYVGPLLGQAVGQSRNASFDYAAGLEMSAPKSGGCWVLSYVVIHYHIGIRHYSAAESDRMVVCAGKNATARANAIDAGV